MDNDTYTSIDLSILNERIFFTFYVQYFLLDTYIIYNLHIDKKLIFQKITIITFYYFIFMDYMIINSTLSITALYTQFRLYFKLIDY